jgi:hypothetical protein
MAAPTPPPVADKIDSFPNLITNVNHTSIGKWTDEILKMFGLDDANKTAINAILTSVKAEVATSDQDDLSGNILKSFKDMQRRYVHVSLFASLSYIYIKNILTSQKTIIERYIQANNTNIATLQTQLAESKRTAETAAELQVQLKALQLKQEEYTALETDLQNRANDLSGFVSGFAEAVGAEAPAAPAAGGSKKKRAQKGGFVRDGTRANLAGDPYPKAS